MIDGAEEYRVEPGSRRDAGSQTNIFPVNAGRRSSRSRDVFMQKIASRWQSVNQLKSTTTATSSEDNGPKERIFFVFSMSFRLVKSHTKVSVMKTIVREVLLKIVLGDSD